MLYSSNNSSSGDEGKAESLNIPVEQYYLVNGFNCHVRRGGRALIKFQLKIGLQHKKTVWLKPKL